MSKCTFLDEIRKLDIPSKCKAEQAMLYAKCKRLALAEFVALELYESFDPEAGDDEQLATAVKVMQSAADDLQAVAHALANIGREMAA